MPVVRLVGVERFMAVRNVPYRISFVANPFNAIEWALPHLDNVFNTNAAEKVSREHFASDYYGLPEVRNSAASLRILSFAIVQGAFVPRRAPALICQRLNLVSRNPHYVISHPISPSQARSTLKLPYSKLRSEERRV